jgi:hypothetical protein
MLEHIGTSLNLWNFFVDSAVFYFNKFISNSIPRIYFNLSSRLIKTLESIAGQSGSEDMYPNSPVYQDQSTEQDGQVISDSSFLF